MMTLVPILITLVGIVIEVSAEHWEKAELTIDVNWFGLVTAPTGQSNQAAYVVTDDGIIDVVSNVPRNADGPNVKLL